MAWCWSRARPSGADPERGILGYCVIETAADELHVHNLAVRPEYRGGGLGRRLLEIALTVGERRGARVALLEVRESNRPAIGALSTRWDSSPSPCAATTTRSPRRTRSYYARTGSPAREISLEITGSGW